MMEQAGSDAVRALMARGVVVPSPCQVQVDATVRPERIAPGVVLHPGVRLTGRDTSIGPGSQIGREGPAVLEDCQLGHDVSFGGGYASGSVLLDGAGMGAGAHLRPGTLLEEQASGAHTVGLKQTILLSYVTLGSLVNFCDVLMAGGTSRRHHSEVGSSYVHFNFTPHGDKATASLVGDVPGGVLLDQAPIFLGGQGGLVGPARIAYGVTLAAGAVRRKDALAADHLYLGDAPKKTSKPAAYPRGRYGLMERLVLNNLRYIGNIQALRLWYRTARPRTLDGDPFRAACRAGALVQLDAVWAERVKRLDELVGKLDASIALLERDEDAVRVAESLRQQRFVREQWPRWRDGLQQEPDETTAAAERDRFLAEWEAPSAAGHTEAVAGLSAGAKASVRTWLQAVVDAHVALWPAPEM